MKNKIVSFIILILACKLLAGQVDIENSEQVKGYMAIPQESVFVDFNSSLLFTGEYLYYSLYCFNNQTKQLSDISKIAYVELLGKGEDPIFIHKIKLDNGIGSGDFFIPVTVETGNYKLIAYTNWMKNKGKTPFFQSDINIINPYHINQTTHQKNKEGVVDSPRTEMDYSKEIPESSYNGTNETEQYPTLILDHKDYKKRSKVSMLFKGLDENKLPTGNYSVSIRKKGHIPKPFVESASDFIEQLVESNTQNTVKVGSKVVLPELRGELFSGKVISKNDSLDVGNLKVVISIPGDNNFFEIAETNKNGEFYTNIDKFYSGNKIFLQVLGKNRNKFEIKPNEHIAIHPSNLRFNNFSVSPAWKNEIIEQSVHNQIESAYFEFKPDSVLSPAPKKLFPNKRREIYNLDDYTRFPTLKETFIEYVKNVSVNKTNKDEYTLRVHGFEFDTNTGIAPLVFVDGVVIQNLTDLLNYKASNIKEISVLRDQFVIGLKTFQGIIDIKTINGIYENVEKDSSIFASNVFKPQIRKNYFSQVYNSETRDSRIPDDRLQLLWMPQLKITDKETKIEFFTSDASGEFEISLEGFTNAGQPVSLKRTIVVE